jgi:hypothetical protein
MTGQVDVYVSTCVLLLWLYALCLKRVRCPTAGNVIILD